MSKRNQEHYWDPTPADAESNIRKQDKAAKRKQYEIELKKESNAAITLLITLKKICRIHGFEFSKVVIKHTASGREYGK